MRFLQTITKRDRISHQCSGEKIWIRESEVPFKQRSEAPRKKINNSTPSPVEVPAYETSCGDSPWSHGTLRVYRESVAHVLSCIRQTVTNKVVIVAIFREPTTRWLSSIFYFSNRRNKPVFILATEAAETGNLTLEHANTIAGGVFCDTCARGYPRPMEEYAYWLGGAHLIGDASGRVTASSGENAIGPAITRVKNEFGVVGLTERMNDTIAILAHRLNRPDLPCMTHRNSAGAGEHARGIASDYEVYRKGYPRETNEMIAREVKHDSVIYKAVVDIHDAQVASIHSFSSLLDHYHQRCNKR